MKKSSLFIFAGLVVLVGGFGVRYVLERGVGGFQSGQANALDTFAGDQNVAKCGEAFMSEAGALTSQQPYLCFAQHLLDCSPANFVAVVENGNIKYSRTIKGMQGGQCMMQEEYTAIAKPDLIGKSMLCAYDPALPLTQVVNYRNCTGELRDELFNRL